MKKIVWFGFGFVAGWAARAALDELRHYTPTEPDRSAWTEAVRPLLATSALAEARRGRRSIYSRPCVSCGQRALWYDENHDIYCQACRTRQDGPVARRDVVRANAGDA